MPPGSRRHERAEAVPQTPHSPRRRDDWYDEESSRGYRRRAFADRLPQVTLGQAIKAALIVAAAVITLLSGDRISGDVGEIKRSQQEEQYATATIIDKLDSFERRITALEKHNAERDQNIQDFQRTLRRYEETLDAYLRSRVQRR